MNYQAYLNALHLLCATPLQLGAQLSCAALLRLGEMCLSLFTAIGDVVHDRQDPRLSLAYAQLVEIFARRVHREQLAAALDLEVSGANALSLPVLDSIRRGDADFSEEPERTQGKPCYRSAEDLLAAWLHINYFAAAARFSDAHLLVGRRTVQGTVAPPRMPNLARLCEAGATDPQQLISTARKLAKLEPKDLIFEGTQIDLQAEDEDGVLLEERCAQNLASLGPRSARKQISTALSHYISQHSEELPPPRGLFIGPVKLGVHEFKLRTTAAQAQVLHSIIAQASSRRTESGRNAGTSQPGPEPSVPEWLIADAPMPEWAAPYASEDPRPAGAYPEQQPANDAEAEVDPPLRKLNAVMAKLGSRPGAGDSTCITPRVVVYMWLHDLYHLARTHGITSNSVRIPPGELRRILASANIIPIVLGGNSQPLDVGRAKRFHVGAIRTAIMARDRGCIVPDCTTAPDQVEIDHYKRPWAEGGTTSVDSGAAICTDGHHSRHVGQIKIVDVGGLPHVILPKHIDPEQIPRRNTYWDGLQLGDAPDYPGPIEDEPPG